MGKVPLMSLFGVAGLLEFVGGALLLLGLGTRPVAFILSGEMAAAYFIGHGNSSSPQPSFARFGESILRLLRPGPQMLPGQPNGRGSG